MNLPCLATKKAVGVLTSVGSDSSLYSDFLEFTVKMFVSYLIFLTGLCVGSSTPLLSTVYVYVCIDYLAPTLNLKS